MITVLRPLSTSELLDRTFHLYRNHFLMFPTITAIPQIPVLALHMADSNLWLRSLIPTRGLRTLFFVALSFVGLEVRMLRQRLLCPGCTSVAAPVFGPPIRPRRAACCA